MDISTNDSRLGKVYQDSATGFEGTCVGIWVGYGSTQLSIAFTVSDGIKYLWIEEARLIEIAPSESGLGFNIPTASFIKRCFRCNSPMILMSIKCCPKHTPEDSDKAVCQNCYMILHPELETKVDE
jgi:hypothetical protein